MFRCHTQHLQHSFVDTVAQLSEALQERLENSWAGEFYREVFCRLDETIFETLYSDAPSRPNVPVNQLVGIEILKSDHNWSDEELFDHLSYDLQTRYAVGARDIETVICTLRTVYNFRRRLSAYMQATGENLLEQAFEQVTDEQCAALKLDTRRQRMDSTQIASNIREYSRLQLVIEVLQRAARMLTETDQARYAETLQPYLQGSAGRYCYALKKDEYAPHLAQVGRVVAQLLTAWASDYETDPAYQILQRVFHEHFTVADAAQPTEVAVKPPEELSATSLQSPDDLEATYRQKNGQGYRGYVVNVTETCHPENPVQLITHVQVAPNATDDQTFLVAAVPEIQERMPLTDLDLDGGYTGPEATQIASACAVALHPTAIRGAQPDPDKVGWEEFAWEYAAAAPAQVTCPQGQTVPLRPGRTAGRYLADCDAETCAACPLRDRCPTQLLKRRPVRTLRVSRRQIEVAQLRQACAATRRAGPPYLRPAVEATVRSIKHPFGGKRGQLPVRGQPRVSMLMLASGFMVNLRRIWRYRQAEREKAAKNSPQAHPNSAQGSFLSRCRMALRRLWPLPWRLTTRRSAMCGC
jgi:hypothetical protein